MFDQKIGYIRSKMVDLNAVIVIINKINIRTQSIKSNYLKPCHDHCFLPTYFQNNKKTHNDLTRRLFTLKRFQYCRFQNTFQLAFSPSLLSTCRSRLLFAGLRERRKFGVDQRITMPLTGAKQRRNEGLPKMQRTATQLINIQTFYSQRAVRLKIIVKYCHFCFEDLVFSKVCLDNFLV